MVKRLFFLPILVNELPNLYNCERMRSDPGLLQREPRFALALLHGNKKRFHAFINLDLIIAALEGLGKGLNFGALR